jgi:hypothetical protein
LVAVEHESYVYSEEEIGSLCAKLVARTLAAKERLAVVADSLDLVELFESTRLPAAAGPDPAVEDPHEAAAGAIAARIAADEETERCAVAIQSVARGRRERARLARLRAEAAAEAEQAASAVRIQSLTGTTGPGGAGGGGGGATVWADDEAEAAVHIQRLARGKLARRKVAGLQRGGETITVRASGSEAAAERARAGDVAKVHDSDAAVAESEAVRAEEAREKEAAVIKIQAIARGRASRRAKQSKGPLTGKAAAMAAVEADVSGDKRAERAASGMVKQGQAAVMSEEDKAAARIQALHRGRLSRKQTDDAKLEARRKRKEEEEQRQQAIVRIQAAARGRAARRHVAVMAATE